MAQRLAQIITGRDQEDRLRQFIDGYGHLGSWYEHLQDDRLLARVHLKAEGADEFLDGFGREFDGKDFKLLMLPVEASLPRPDQNQEATRKNGDDGPKKSHHFRVSKEELWTDVADTVSLDVVHLVMVVLSAVVAAIGIIRGNMAIIIGAMVIAPLLGPNMALALATTLGDKKLGLRSLGIVGLWSAVSFAVAAGLGLMLDFSTDQFNSPIRSSINLGDIILAVVAGTAGSLALTTGISTSLIGVMVAVALLPPLVTAGLMIGSGLWSESSASIEVYFANLIALNLSAVLTFLVMGVRPTSWWDEKRARKATIAAVAVWTVLLAALVALVAYFQDDWLKI